MRKAISFLCATVALLLPASASADIALSQLIVELQPGKHDRQDVEITNNGADQAFVAVEPREIVSPGASPEQSRTDADPAKLGLLVSPTRLILEPGQHRLMRFATLAPGDRERVYRVTVKPVVGKLAAKQSGLKLLLGYDVLVLVRPAVARAAVTATRNGHDITFRNDGNVSVELTDGRQCDASGSCASLPDKRLYAGASWTVQLKQPGPAEYTVESPGHTDLRRF